MTDKREAIERRALIKKAAAAKSEALFERVADVVDTVHLILTKPDFAKVLRAEGVYSVPRCLRRQPDEIVESGCLDEISLEFIIVWKFMFPLLSRPAIESYLKNTRPNFIPQFKDAFISLVTEGPFPSALSGHMGNRRGPQNLRRGRRRGASRKQ